MADWRLDHGAGPRRWDRERKGSVSGGPGRHLAEDTGMAGENEQSPQADREGNLPHRRRGERGAPACTGSERAPLPDSPGPPARSPGPRHRKPVESGFLGQLAVRSRRRPLPARGVGPVCQEGAGLGDRHTPRLQSPAEPSGSPQDSHRDTQNCGSEGPQSRAESSAGRGEKPGEAAPQSAQVTASDTG